jgi:glycosyltransferase involved in cell wall biosynthesis
MIGRQIHNMRLSVGVPAYNQGNFLEETLDSLLDQDVPFYEIVVSNNHSTDATAETISRVQQKYPGRIRLVMPPQHLTMAANWNFTASQLSGDWFSLLSSDDLALPNFVRSVRSATALSSNAVLIRGGWRNINQKGEVQGDHYLLSVSTITTPPKTLYEQRFGPKGAFAAFALRRDIWERVGKFPEEVTLLGDWSMWLLAGAIGDIICTNDLIASLRSGHQSSVIRGRHHIHVQEMLTVYEHILPKASHLGGFGKPTWIAEASRKNFRDFIIGTSQEYSPGERKELIEAFRPWAKATGQLPLFERFERGEVMRTYSLSKILRLFFRRVAMVLYRS